MSADQEADNNRYVHQDLIVKTFARTRISIFPSFVNFDLFFTILSGNQIKVLSLRLAVTFY